MADNSGSVFPIVNRVDGDGDYYHTCEGLTKRELFAAMAMQGILAEHAGPMARDVKEEGLDYEACADIAVMHADALLAALSEPTHG